MNLSLPPGYAALSNTTRQVVDAVLSRVLEIDGLQCLLWGGSSVSRSQGVERDIDLWAIVEDPNVAKIRFMANLRGLSEIAHLHDEGYVRWFGQLVTAIFFPECTFAIDIGFAPPAALDELNIGPRYWILYCQPTLRDAVTTRVQPRTFVASEEERASTLLVNVVKLRKSLGDGDTWNALEHLARARRALMGLIRDQKDDIEHIYSRPDRGLVPHLTQTELRCLESTVAGPETAAIARAATRVVKQFLATAGPEVPSRLRDHLLMFAGDLIGSPRHRDDVGVIGIGRMGGRLIRHLVAAGHCVRINDVDTEKIEAGCRAGAKAAGLSEIWDRSDIVLLSLPSPEIIDDVLSTILRPCPPRRIIVDLSTNAPDWVIRAAARSCEKGHGYVDAPVSGGPWGAAAGSLVVMAGGVQTDVEKARPVLECFAGEVVYVGPSGHGSMAKLIHNLVGEVQVHAFAEAFTIAARLGIDLNALYRCLAGGMVSSRVLTDLYANAGLRRQWDANVTLATATKDQRLLLDLATRTGIQPIFTSEIIDRQYTLLERGLADADVTVILQWFEDRYGVKIRVDSPPLPPIDCPP